MSPTRAREARPGPIDRFIDAVAAISRLGGVAAVALLLAAVLVICQLVFMRYVLQASTIWQHEFVTFSLIGATFIGAPYVLLTHGHVNVDLVPLYLGPRGRLALAIVAALVTLAFCAVLTWYGAAFWYKAWANDWHAETVWRPPLWIPYFALPLGMGLLTLQTLAGLLALLTGRQAPFAAAPPQASEPT
jgi:TRAP-type C4-dicarboxylate transport system permease small subunit